jgi:hypothetical protein
MIGHCPASEFLLLLGKCNIYTKSQHTQNKVELKEESLLSQKTRAEEEKAELELDLQLYAL